MNFKKTSRVEKLLRGGGAKSSARGAYMCQWGIHVSVYMHVNVSTNNDSTK